MIKMTTEKTKKVESKKGQRHNVKPIRDTWVLREVQNSLKDDFETGERNYTIFQTGKATLLRVSDVLSLKKSDVYNANGTIKRNAYITDKKTGKPNTLYIRPVANELMSYYTWLEEYQQKHPDCNVFFSPWLFPSFRDPRRHINRKRYYRIMKKVGNKLGLDYLGTHTMRKTGAYMVYEQTNHNIALVMKLLNHSSEEMTLAYLGLDQESREHILDTINFY